MVIIKKDGTREAFDGMKIRRAVEKSAARAMVTLTDKDYKGIVI